MSWCNPFNLTDYLFFQVIINTITLSNIIDRAPLPPGAFRLLICHRLNSHSGVLSCLQLPAFLHILSASFCCFAFLFLWFRSKVIFLVQLSWRYYFLSLQPQFITQFVNAPSKTTFSLNLLYFHVFFYHPLFLTKS